MQNYEKKDVTMQLAALRAASEGAKKHLSSKVSVSWYSKDTTDLSTLSKNKKLVHFIRHGEGYHNVAQKEWRSRPDWDGKSDPYTFDLDPNFKYLDPLLTPVGEQQAKDLQTQTAHLNPDVIISSTLRRAIQTGLIAFEDHISNKETPFVASELCHEMGGYHTCDKRLDVGELKDQFTELDFSGVASESDPLWLDGFTRETWEHLAGRAAQFVEFLHSIPETHIAVASHSSFLLATFNAPLESDEEPLRTWFGTGEMRSVILEFKPKN